MALFVTLMTDLKGGKNAKRDAKQWICKNSLSKTHRPLISILIKQV